MFAINFINFDGRTFVSIQNTENGEVSSETLFHYKQRDRIVWADYSGGGIVIGHLVGTVDDNGVLNMSYHHINEHGELMTGLCKSTPEILEDGLIRMHEQWQWTCKDHSRGHSIIEEIKS